MIPSRAFQAAILYPILGTSLLCAADFSTYRGFQFESTLAKAAEQVKLKPSDAKLLHQRPAVIQELDWRPGSPYLPTATQMDPVREVRLRFYNGALFQIVTIYDREKVEGMSESDMVEALSQTYGTATKPVGEIAFHSNYGEAAKVIARWENPDYSNSLVRTGDLTSFALILSSKHLDALAEAAIVEAGRLDALEAPQRAIDLQKKQDLDGRLVLDKARTLNKPNFRP